MPRLRESIATLGFVAALMVLPTLATAQTNGTWTSTTGGTWSDSANWSGTVVAGGTGAVADFSSLNISGVQTVTLNSPVTSGTLLFGDTTTPAGGWTVTGDTLTLATAAGVPTISVTGLGSAYNFGTAAATISSVIAGTNGLNKSGASALVLSNANTYSGTTTVGAGFLVLNHNSALGNTSGVSVANGGAVAIGNGITAGSGRSVSILSNGVNSDGGLTAISGGTGTWAGAIALGGRIGYQFSTLVLSGSIGGSNALTISAYGGAGSTGAVQTSINTQYGVVVAGTNNGYTGQTAIGRGVLKIGADNALPTNTTLDIRMSSLNGNEAAGFDLNGFNQTVAVLSSSGISAGSGSVTSLGSAFLTNSGSTVKTFTANQATSGTFYGMITGNLAFTKSGAGNLTLTPVLVSVGVGTTGTSTFSGDTFVSAGTLTLGNANALFGSTFDTASTGTLSFGSLTAATFGGLKNSGTVTLANSGSAFALSVGGNNVSSTFAGRLTGLGGLTKVGSGTFTLTGNASDYAGATTLAGGGLALGSAGALPASGAIVFSGGALQYTASNTTDYTSRIASSGSAVAIDTNGQSVTFTGGIDSTNTGGFRKLGSGTLTLSGSSGYTGATTLAGGVLALGNTNSIAAAGNVTFIGGTLQYSASNTADLASRIASSTSAITIDTNGQSVAWAGNLAGTNTGGLAKTGDGTLTLSGSNTFTGVVSVTGGTLAVSGTNAFPTGVTGVTLSGGALQAAGGGSLNSPGGVPSGATITLGSAGGTLANGLTGQWFIWAPLAGGAGTGPLSLSGTTGGETILQSTSSSYTGGTILSNQVAINADTSLGTGTITFAGGGLRATSTGVRTLANSVIFSGNASFPASSNNLVLAGPMTLSGSTQSFTTTGTFSTSLSGAIGEASAGLGITKAGAGILVLGGVNTFSGTTTINAGTLRLANASALGGGGNLSFTGGTLQYSGSNQADYSSRIVGSSSPIAIDTNGQSVSYVSALAATNAGGLTKSGSGALTLAADNAYTGLTTVSGGTLQIGDGGTTGSIAGNLTLSNAATTVFNRSNALTYSGSISGSNGTLMKAGGGALTLAGTSGMTGGTIAITGGALITTNASSLATGASFNTFAFTIDSGTLASAAGAASTGISGRVGSLAIGAGGATIRSDLRFDTSAVISGTSPTASLTYGTTSGTVSSVLMVISGASTYAGGTKIESGIDMVVDNNNAFGAGTLELAGARLRSRAGPPRTLANALTISANTQFFGGASEPNLTFTNATLLSGGTRTLQVDNVITSGTSAGQPGVIFTNVIGDGGNGFGITKAGAGVLALGGANTYSGATTLSAGTIQLQNQNALQNSTLSLSGIGGVVFDSVVSGNAFTLGGLASSSGVATLGLQNSAATAIALVVGGNNASATYAGSLTGAGSLEKVGSGSLILSGSSTFAGTTTVTSGTLQIGGGGTAGTLAGNVVNNASLVFNRSDSSTYGGGISGSGSLTKSGAGMLVLSGSNSYAGATTLAGGMVAVGGTNALPSSGNVTFTGGSLQYSASYTADLSSRIVGSSAAVTIDTNGQNRTWASSLADTNVGGLTKEGSGTLTLSASNAYSGATTVTGVGSLLVTNAAALGSGSTVLVDSGAALVLGSGITTGQGKTVTVNSFAPAGGLQGASGTGTWAGNVTMGLNGRLGYDQSGSLVVSGSLGGTGLVISGYGGDTNTNVAGYAVTLAGPTGYSGATSILRGWLKIGADDTLPVGTTLDVFTVANNGAAAQAATFDLNGFNQTVAGLTSSGNNGKTGFANGYVTNTGGTVKTLTVNQAASGTFGGLVTGNVAFTKTGAGNLTLMPIFVTTANSNAFVNGTNTFTGDTRVDGGTLTLSAATGSTSLALAGSTFDSDGAGTLSFGSMTAATFGGLKGSGNLILQNGSTLAVALTVGANGGSTIYSGGLSGAGSVVKTGTGKLTITGNNSYAGTTTVSGGILALNGDQSEATGAVSIASLATLMGSGTIGGDATIAGFHNPGNSPGIQTFAGDLTYSGGTSTVLWELGANTVSNSPLAYDQIVVGGDLAFAGATVLSLSFNGTGSTVNWLDTFWDSSRTWTLYSVSGTTTGLGNLALSGSPASWFDTQATPQSLSAARPDASFSIVQDGSNVNVVYAIVPEPGSLVLAGIGIAAAAWAIRRKQV